MSLALRHAALSANSLAAPSLRPIVSNKDNKRQRRNNKKPKRENLVQELH
jgi:hypothetical protein